MSTAAPPIDRNYHAVARWLHWIIGIMVILNIVGGLAHDTLEGVIAVMPLHKAVGITILALTVARIAWRIGHAPPAFPPAISGFERIAAKATHHLFYALLVIVPLSGWIMSSPGDRPLTWFGLFAIPKFAVGKDDAIVGVAHEAHELLGIAFGVLALIHIAAALRHHFILRDDVLRRMTGSA